MRILAPILGPILTADLRLLVGGLVLFPLILLIRRKRKEKLPYLFLLVLGIFNSGLPFLLYSFAALHIPGSVSSIVNSLTPVFGAVYAALWLNEGFTWRKGVGLTFGVLGVAVISSGGSFVLSPWSFAAVGACVLATNCYALSGVAIKKRALKIDPIVLAGLTQIGAGAVIFPLALVHPVSGVITGKTVILVFLFGALCSGLAYVFYYRLITDEGPTKALSVTFLIPLFGILWGRLFLGEPLKPATVAGMVIILSGTYLVVFQGRSPSGKEREMIEKRRNHGR